MTISFDQIKTKFPNKFPATSQNKSLKGKRKPYSFTTEGKEEAYRNHWKFCVLPCPWDTSAFGFEAFVNLFV